MGVKSRLTEKMLRTAVFNVDPARRTWKTVNAELMHLFGVSIGRTVYTQRMKGWEILAEVKEGVRREAQEAVAKALVGEAMDGLRSQIGGLNRVEDVIGKMLDKAEATLEGVTLEPSLEGVGEALIQVQNLMRTSTLVRKDMADVETALGGRKKSEAVDPTEAGDNIVSFEEEAERYK